MSEPADLGKVQAKFVVTQKQVSILANYREISLTIMWPRHDHPGETARHLRTLLGTMPDVIKDGLNEVFVQDQAKRIEFELQELFKDEDEKRAATEEFGPGPLDGRGDE